MTRLIDLFFTFMFFGLAIVCIVVFLTTGCNRVDLAVYAIFSAILTMILVRNFREVQ